LLEGLLKSSFLKQIKKPKTSPILKFGLIIFVGVWVFGFFYFKRPTLTTHSPQVSQQSTQITKQASPVIKQFGLQIDKIGVLVPVIENVDGTQKVTYNKALEKGVAHYQGTSLPGQGGNIFIFGHSSTILGKGPYAQIFAQLNELQKGDLMIVYYKGKKFVYSVFEKQVVEKNNLSVLQPTAKEQLTLMTCWPIGSNAKRLIIKGELK